MNRTCSLLLPLVIALAAQPFSASHASAIDFIIEPETIVVSLAEEIPNLEEGSECSDPDYWAGAGVDGGGDWQNGRDDGPYSSEEDAVQDAVDGASSGDTIYLCLGTWNFGAVVEIDKDLNIVGSGQTYTILDGGDASQIFTTWIGRGDPLVYSGYALNLSDLTIQHANSDGGAVNFNQNSSITRCTFQFNQSTNTGGAVFGAALLVVQDSMFLENHSRWSGGAILSSFLEVRGTEFIGNSNVYAEDGNDDASGGAISVVSDALIEDSVFRGNQAEWNTDGAGTDWGFGGAIFQITGSLTIKRSVFTENIAGSGGAVYQFYQGPLDISGNTFNGNRAENPEGQGGAVRISAITSDASITRNRFSRNEAWQGGALSMNDSGDLLEQSWEAAVTRNDFWLNRASESGGALHFALDDSGRVSPKYLSRNRFVGNRASVGGAMVVESNVGTTRQILRRYVRVLRINRFVRNQAYAQRSSSRIGVHFD